MDPRIADYLCGTLALRPQALRAVAERKPRTERVSAYRDDADLYTRMGAVAHLPVDGPMVFGGGMWAWLFGMCDTERLSESLHAAADDDSIGTVLLDIDSPGGDVAGMADLVAACDAVKAAGKKLVAVAHDAAFSAAYWLASQADELYLTETAVVGSIGAFTVLYDSSEAYAEMGVRPVLVASTALKGVNVPGVGITDAQVAAETEPVMEIHRAFVAAVARGRKIGEDIVDEWTTSADAVGAVAVDRGMADGIVSFSQLLAGLSQPNLEMTMAGKTKSAAAVARAAGKVQAAAKAEDAPTEEKDEEQMSAEELREKYPNAVAEIEKQAAEKAEEPEPEPEEEETQAAAGHTFSAYRGAFEAAKIELSTEARAFITEAQEDNLTPTQAVSGWKRLQEKVATSAGSAAVRQAAQATEPVGGGARPGRTGGGAKAELEQRVATKLAANPGMTKTEAHRSVLGADDGLRARLVEEANAA